MTDPDTSARTEALEAELARLRGELETLNSHRWITLYDSWWRLGFYQIYVGLLFGLGSVLGATILVALIVRMLSSIDFIPVLGDWAQQIIDQLEPPS